MDLNVLNMPEQFVCPITTKLLIEPVLSVSCGHHFERSAVEGRVNLVCPIDGIPLSQHLYPAREFQEVIKHWVTLDQWARCMETQLKRLLKKENDNTNLEPVGAMPHAPLVYTPTQSRPNNTISSLLNINTDSDQSAAFASRNASQVVDRKISNAVAPNPVSNNIIIQSPGIPPSTSAVSITDSGEKVPVDPRKYKTRLCRSWLQFGNCPYSEMCCFAHGDTELRDAATNLKVLDALRYVDFENVDQNAQANTTTEPVNKSKGRNKTKATTPNSNSVPLTAAVPKSQSEPKLSNETLRQFLSGQSSGSPFLYFAPGPNPVPSDNHM